MRLVDLLICILEAHVGTLRDLLRMTGETELLKILDIAHNEPTYLARPQLPAGSLVTLDPSIDPFYELEKFMASQELSRELENYVWEYPHYRALVEGPLPLNGVLPFKTLNQDEVPWVEEALVTAQSWLNKLRLPGEIAKEADGISRRHWIKFRSAIFDNFGKRKLRTVPETDPGKA